MKISVDISMYPLQSEFEKPITAFIEALAKDRRVNIIRTELSTQIYGEYDVIKIVGEDRKGRF